MNALWDVLKKADMDRDYITASCCRIKGDGLVSGHAYSVIGVVRLSTGTKLVQVRNPWGSGEWTGAWSDNSEKWTAELKKEAKFENKVDGAFFIRIVDYHKRFGNTFINYDTSNWDKTSFLMLGDDTKKRGAHKSCGRSCIRHEFKLTSEIK